MKELLGIKAMLTMKFRLKFPKSFKAYGFIFRTLKEY